MDGAKKSVEAEGLKVPSQDVIKYVIEKYKEKLGPDAVDSLLYSISKGLDIVKENKNGKTK